jgi:hypothetical protein
MRSARTYGYPQPRIEVNVGQVSIEHLHRLGDDGPIF